MECRRGGRIPCPHLRLSLFVPRGRSALGPVRTQRRHLTQHSQIPGIRHRAQRHSPVAVCRGRRSVVPRNRTIQPRRPRAVPRNFKSSGLFARTRSFASRLGRSKTVEIRPAAVRFTSCMAQSIQSRVSSNRIVWRHIAANNAVEGPRKKPRDAGP